MSRIWVRRTIVSWPATLIFVLMSRVLGYVAAEGAEPETYERSAILRIHPRPEMTAIIVDGNPVTGLPWTGPPPTSRSIIGAALDMPGIGDLPWIASRKTAKTEVDWLAQQIKVASFRPADSKDVIVMIGMKGDDSWQLALLVNAVAQGYLDRVVCDERLYLRDRRDQLKAEYEASCVEFGLLRIVAQRPAEEIAADKKNFQASQQLRLDAALQLRKEITAKRSILFQHNDDRGYDSTAIKAELEKLENHFENLNRAIEAMGTAFEDRRQNDLKYAKQKSDRLRAQLQESELELYRPACIVMEQEAAVHPPPPRKSARD